MTCSVLLCKKECLIEHYIGFGCTGDKIVPVKHSRRDEGVIPFCEDHKCFSKLYCVNCLTYICVYCKNRACNKLPQHNCVGLSDFSSNFDNPYKEFQNKAEQVKGSCQKTKGQINLALNEKVPELKTYINNFKYKLLTTTWLTLNKVEDELCNKFAESCEEYKKENNQALNKAKKVISGSKKNSQNSRGFAKILNYQNLKTLTEDLDNDTENNFSVEFETPGVSFEEDLFKLIDTFVGKVTLSLNTNDVTDILPQSSVVRDSSDLVQMRLEESIEDNDTYKRCFLKLASELDAQQTGNGKI